MGDFDIFSAIDLLEEEINEFAKISVFKYNGNYFVKFSVRKTDDKYPTYDHLLKLKADEVPLIRKDNSLFKIRVNNSIRELKAYVMKKWKRTLKTCCCPWRN